MNNDNHLLAKIGQYALIRKDGQVLVLERDRSKTWSLPGGRLNVGEDWNNAFIREIKEETNLNITEVKPFTTNILTDLYQTKYCVYFETFVSDFKELKISPEHSNYMWLDLKNISKIKFEDELVTKVVFAFLNVQNKL